MAIESITDRPPFVTFEFRAVEDRDASIKAGHYVGKDVAYAIITRPGSRDTLDKEAEVWLNDLQKRGDIPMTWYPAFRQRYEEWKKGEIGEVIGTPIKGWAVLGVAAQKTLIAAGIMSVEDLANVPDQDLNNVGTGAIGFKMKARAFLEAAQGPGKLTERIVQTERQIVDLVDLTKNQAEEIQRLRALVPAEQPKEPAKAAF